MRDAVFIERLGANLKSQLFVKAAYAPIRMAASKTLLILG